jgi:hypothetical protein
MEQTVQSNIVSEVEHAQPFVIIPISVIESPDGKGLLGGKAAYKAVADYVHTELGLKEDDSTTHCYYWETEWWNKPNSMVGDGKGGWNGGFRTNLGYALSGRTKEDVKNARGTGGKLSNGDGVVGENGEKATTSRRSSSRTLTSGPTKLLVELDPDIEKGIAYLSFGANGDCTFSAEDCMIIASTSMLSTWGRQIQIFASNPREAMLSASETKDGNVVQPGWSYSGDGEKTYTSTKSDRGEAAQDVVNQIVGKLDMPNIKHIEKILTDESVLVNTGHGIKSAWIDRWLPKPPVVEVEQPAQPSETPMTKEEEQAAYREGKMADAVSMAEQPKVEARVEEPAKVEEQPIPVEIPQPEMAEVAATEQPKAEVKTPAQKATQRAKARIVAKTK